MWWPTCIVEGLLVTIKFRTFLIENFNAELKSDTLWCLINGVVCLGVLPAAIGWSAPSVCSPRARCQDALCNIRCSTATRLSWTGQCLCSSAVSGNAVTNVSSGGMATGIYSSSADAGDESASIARQFSFIVTYVYHSHFCRQYLQWLSVGREAGFWETRVFKTSSNVLLITGGCCCICAGIHQVAAPLHDMTSCPPSW